APAESVPELSRGPEQDRRVTDPEIVGGSNSRLLGDGRPAAPVAGRPAAAADPQALPGAPRPGSPRRAQRFGAGVAAAPAVAGPDPGIRREHERGPPGVCGRRAGVRRPNEL